ncbi:MAG: molybdate ABC transporter substrate-binding protein [Rhodospirillales bacterium]
MLPAPAFSQAKSLLVAAAADLATAGPPLAQAFERAAGIRVQFVFGASGMLARQIENGAPYDVYLSANEPFVADLARSGRVEAGTVRVYALGRLGLWSRRRSFSSLDELRDASFRHVAIANPVHAPYGAAAKQALENKGGLWKELEPRIVYGENVRQALQYAESGNAEAVITSWSLVFDRGALLLPETLHAPIRQSGGMVASTKNAAGARAFLDFLGSPQGRAILKEHGLGLPPSRLAPPR